MDYSPLFMKMQQEAITTHFLNEAPSHGKEFMESSHWSGSISLDCLV